MGGNAVFEIDPLPQGALVGLAPTKQISKPQNWTMKHYKSIFCQILECQDPCTNVKPPYL